MKTLNIQHSTPNIQGWLREASRHWDRRLPAGEFALALVETRRLEAGGPSR